VVVAEGRILEPLFEVPDILIAMVQTAVDKYFKDIRPSTRVLIDADLVRASTVPAGAEVLAIPATRIAEDLEIKAGANVVMLGFLAAVNEELATLDSLEQAVRTSVPPKTVERNIMAFRAGHAFGRKLVADSEGGSS
jgi:Pyruvate/2-oxoacid:ferredoxin oxidoreductase gamma subunit